MELSAGLITGGICALLTLGFNFLKRSSTQKAKLSIIEVRLKRTTRQCAELVSRQQLNSRRRQLEIIETLAREEELLLSHEEHFANTQATHDAQSRQRKSELQKLEMDISELKARVDSIESDIKAKQELARDVKNSFTSELETIAKSRSEAVTAELVDQSKESYLHRLEIRRRTAREEAESNATPAARRVLGLTLNRYDGVGHLERISNHIEMPNKGFDLLRNPASELSRHISEALDVELWDKGDNHIGIRGENPLGREAARRVLTRLSQNWTDIPDRVLRLCHRVNNQLNDEVLKAGRGAVRSLEMEKVHPDIVSLIGRLKFRLSYSQNQLLHAVEVARLAGVLANELGLDVKQAMRGGLMHDIGKAMTHDHEGSHAVLGAEVARRCGELEVIANAIGSHHNDEPMNTPIAHIVTAADALSGARPGARRETASLYLARMQQLSDIAHNSGEGIERVDIMHAGREIRLAVPGSERLVGEKPRSTQYDDGAMIDLAEELAKTIEEEVIYPGQIRVTVVRESRASAVAR